MGTGFYILWELCNYSRELSPCCMYIRTKIHLVDLHGKMWMKYNLCKIIIDQTPVMCMNNIIEDLPCHCLHVINLIILLPSGMNLLIISEEKIVF